MNITVKENLSNILQNIKGIVWDLDNTLYRSDDALHHAFNIAISRAIKDKGVDLPFDEIVRMAKKSWLENGHSGQVFIDEYGIDHKELHFAFHGFIDEKIIGTSIETKELFASISLPHILITHSVKDWAMRVLKHLGLKEFFPDDHVFAFEDFDFQSKAQSRLPFETALKTLDLEAGDTMMIEDLSENLRIPYEMGMTTVFIHHGQKQKALSDHIMYACDSAVDILKKIKDQDNEST